MISLNELVAVAVVGLPFMFAFVWLCKWFVCDDDC